MQHSDVVIIGGGLAGLTCALLLSRKDLDVVVIEKQQYPFHRVCGEYISNEVRPFLERLGIFPHHLNPPMINKLLLTSTNGSTATVGLPMGGFGISRYQFDYFLHKQAIKAGVGFITKKNVQSATFEDEQFILRLNDQQVISCTVAVGAFGKRSVLDKHLERPFIKRRSPYLAVKYHLRGDFSPNLIALHNFEGGYAGISTVENQIINLCYLASRNDLRKFNNIRGLEEKVLMKNPYLKSIFTGFEFLFEKPKVINEVSFESKKPVVNHMLMCGDAAGLITPLCGNGMAMAMHSSNLLAPLILKYFDKSYYSRSKLEQDYAVRWDSQFKQRLWTGRKIQRLFGNRWSSSMAVNLVRNLPPIARYLIKQTHGQAF